ncbi:LamG domain-containing protein, partial [Verrucomicrobiales bacterium]|nr:LamG domain-containing protein [Verrucomicrobiales bacterium]
MGRNFGLLAIVGMLVGSIAIGQQRSSEGLRVLYDFADAKGDVVKDRAGDLDLKVSKTSGVKRSAGALEIHGPTLIRSVKPAQKMTEVAKATQAMTIEAWIKPSNTSQEGPARIVTLSYDSTNRNFTLGQEKDVFDVRFRTSKTSKNGMPSVMTKAVKTELTHVVYTFDKSGKALLFVNGKQRSDENVGADLNSWDGKYHLALGDEMVGSRLWKGTYFLVAIFDRALAAKEIEQHFKAGI